MSRTQDENFGADDDDDDDDDDDKKKNTTEKWETGGDRWRCW